jgi:cytochrome c551/c552
MTFFLKFIVCSAVWLVLAPFGELFSNQNNKEGENIFKTVCMVCHTIGKGRLVGPDLKDVHNRRSEIWLKKFIISSNQMVKSGDKEAVEIFNEYNGMPMPDHVFSDTQLLALIEYIKLESALFNTDTKKNSKNMLELGNSIVNVPNKVKLKQNDINFGQDLFTGIHKFEKLGPACSSCHNVNISNVITGGSLAVDLTSVYSRMNDAGVASIIKSPPFPVMNKAYKDRNLNSDEVFALQAFLQNVNNSSNSSMHYSKKLFGAGISGVLLLFGLFSIIWGNRKRECVNEDIYNRQIKSE